VPGEGKSLREEWIDSGSESGMTQGEKSSLVREDLGGYLSFNCGKVETHPRPLPIHGGEKNAAFTLAEVLITLAIIGVVAVMTIPTLISDYQEKVTVTKMKKMYAALNQAHRMYRIENGSIPSFPDTSEGNTSMYEVFKPYLRVSQDCGINPLGCASVRYRADGTHVGTSGSGEYGVILADSSSISFRGHYSPDVYLGVVYYDVNGEASPNMYGRDVFQFFILPDRVLPAGEPYEANQSESDKFETGCAASTALGYACAGWVVHKGNQDYLKCPDELTWADSKCSD